MAYLGESISKLGFGLMRLPMCGEEVDLPQLKQMVDLFLERGFTYFDTAYSYSGGKSEAAIREALVERYPRERFQLATKLPAWEASSAEEARQMFWTSLERTGAGYFDFYLLHNLGAERTAYFAQYDIWHFLKARRDEGLIRHLGFSFHDSADVLDELLAQHPEIEFVQLQINYADWESPTVQSRRCYEVAQKHGLPVVIMEPVKGGSLCLLPEAAEQVFKTAAPEASLASWAIRYAASLDGLITVLSGMSSLEQLQDNTEYMTEFRPLDGRERAAVAQVQEILASIPQVPCTGCRYCVDGCPQEVAIPGIFRGLNNYLLFHNLAGAKSNYAWETRYGGVASKCICCGQCESVCPQKIPIIAELKRAAALLEEEK